MSATPAAATPASALLAEADRRLGLEEAEHAVLALFGVEGRASALTGERDQNFRIEAADGRAFVLKVSHSAEPPEVTDLQNQALLHLARHDAVSAPRLQPGRDGGMVQAWPGFGGEAPTMRLLSFLPGVPLAQIQADEAMLEGVGSALAALDLAFADFSHPADDHALTWDLARATESRRFLHAIADPILRDRAGAGFDRFSSEARPFLPDLRRQFIHNDLNPHNVLVSPTTGVVTGVLDLGDALRAPLIHDLAVAAAYHLRPGGDAFSGVAAMVRGFTARLPLRHEEVAMLPALMAGRLAMTLAITAWRAERHPANRAYILRNAPVAAAGLEALLETSPEETRSRLSEAARLAP